MRVLTHSMRPCKPSLPPDPHPAPGLYPTHTLSPLRPPGRGCGAPLRWDALPLLLPPSGFHRGIRAVNQPHPRGARPHTSLSTRGLRSATSHRSHTEPGEQGRPLASPLRGWGSAPPCTAVGQCLEVAARAQGPLSAGAPARLPTQAGRGLQCSCVPSLGSARAGALEWVPMRAKGRVSGMPEWSGHTRPALAPPQTHEAEECR